MVFTPYGPYRNRADELMKQVPIDTINHLVNLPGEDLVRLYSYQGQKAWDAAVERGYWTGSAEAIPNGEDECREFKDAYDWVKEQMGERLPSYSGDYPMWAWVKRPSTKPKETRFMGTSGDIRLTVLVPRSRILFSDYETWHSVLNQGCIHRTEALSDQHSSLYWETDENFRRTERSILASRQTWPACLSFQPAVSQEEMSWGVPKKYFRVQACVDRFHWNEVVSVRRFDINKYNREN